MSMNTVNMCSEYTPVLLILVSEAFPAGVFTHGLDHSWGPSEELDIAR